MISRFFGKTQPIQYVVLLVFLFAFHWLYAVRIVGEQLTPNAILGQLLLFALVAISILFADMMVKKHKITGQHSFFMLFWVLLIILFPNTVAEAKAMVLAQAMAMASCLWPWPKPWAKAHGQGYGHGMTMAIHKC